MKPTIQGLWIGDHLSTVEQLCAASFLANGHQFDLYTYGRVKNIPNGVTIRDANEILPKCKIFTSHNGSYAIFADWFRWELLRQRGGYWVDMDIICLKPFDFKDEIIFGIQQGDEPAIGVLKFPACHPLTMHMVERCIEPNKIQPYDPPRTKIHKTIRKYLKGNRRDRVYWGEAGGPFGFAKAVQQFNLQHFAKNYTYFYPVHHTHWKCIFDETYSNDAGLFSTSYGVHLWNELIRKDGFNKDGIFPRDSLIEQLKVLYFDGYKPVQKEDLWRMNQEFLFRSLERAV